MHVGILKTMIPPSTYPGIIQSFGFFFYLKRPNTSWNSLNVPIPGLALPKTIPSLAVFACFFLAGNANCSFLRHHAVWAIAANIFWRSVPARQLVSNGPPFSHGPFSRVLDGNEGTMEEIGGTCKLRKGPGWVPFFWVFPKGEIILGILEMPGTHEKPKLP